MMPAYPKWFPPDDMVAPVVWRRCWESATGRGFWEDLFVFDLGLVASTTALYVREATAIAAGLKPPNPEMTEYRQLVREMLSDWGLLSARCPAVSALRRDGVDVDIARICGLPDEPP
jgi:hypothetical protein